MIKFTIYFLGLIATLTNVIISPTMNQLTTYFSNVDPVLVKYILTIPSLLIIPSALLSIPLSDRFGEKKVLIIALLVYGVAGCAVAFADNIYTILFLRALFGIGVGLLTPILKALPADFFKGEEEHIVVARTASFSSVGNIIFILIAGLVSAYSWHYTFLVYAVGFFVLASVIFFLPDIPPVKPTIKDSVYTSIKRKTTHTSSKIFTPYFNLLLLSMLIYMVIKFLLFTDYALILAERGFTNPNISAFAFALSGVVSFFIAYYLHTINDKFGKLLYISVPLCIGLSYIIMYYAHSITFFFLAQVFAGITTGVYIPLSVILALKVLPQESSVKGMAYLTAVMFVGQLISPLFFDMLGNNTEENFLLMAIVCFVITALMLILNVKNSGVLKYSK